MEEQSSGSVDRIYAGLEASINNQINPPVLVQQAPWLNTTTTSTTTTTTTVEPTTTSTTTTTTTIE